MDLELSDEQRWLSESVEALLSRHDEALPDTLWQHLVEFGVLAVGDDGLGAIELCLIARAVGAHLAPVPYLGSAAVRYALGDDAAAPLGDDAVALALLEPGGGWRREAADGVVESGALRGRKGAVEHRAGARRLALSATGPGGPVLALVGADAPGVARTEQPAFDPTSPMHAVAFEDVAAEVVGGDDSLERLAAIGALLAAAEAVGAAGKVLDLACAYAAERRQFGRPIGSFQALRHLLADAYVRQASSWSSVLYAAAALDEGAEEAARTASIAKAYVSRAAREVAQGAIQVF
ncbi:MAG: acyl-CoA dehydrogenase family protein, partial [Polyangia bacterium]